MTRLANAGCIVETLRPEHADLLAPYAEDTEIWRWMPTPPPGPGLRPWIEDSIRATAGEVFLLRTPEGTAAGTSRIHSLERAHRRCEIGYTWFGAPFRGTGLNTAVKLAMLTHCFEDLHMERVQFRCDVRNERSARALEKLGARLEGVLRRHDQWWDGHVRDAMVWSIVRSEWPGVQASLAARMPA